jgi:hypothetical protein
MTQIRILATALLTLGAVLTVGCNTGPATAPVGGKVVANGQPVTGGSLTFAPITDKPNAASAPVIAEVKPDGTFQVAGGAVEGKFSVAYAPPSVNWEAPEWDGTGAPPQAPPTPFAGMAPKDKEVTFSAQANQLNIELVPAGRT